VYQIVVYSKNGELRFDDLCLEGSKNSPVKFQKCTESNQRQIWNYQNDTKQMVHKYSGQCMAVDPKKDTGKLILEPCQENHPSNQRWTFEQAMLT